MATGATAVKAAPSSPALEYIDQTPADLRFFVVKGPIELEQFTILEQMAYRWNGMAVRMAIIGESHFVSVQTPAGTFTEICACTDLKPQVGVMPEVATNPMAMTDGVSSSIGDLSYSCVSTYHTKNAGETALAQLLDDADRLASDAPETTRLLHMVFPTMDPALPIPQTLVLAEAGDDLVVRSAHTYPDHGTIVLTESRLSARTPGPSHTV